MPMAYQWREDSRFPVAADIAAERLKLIKKSAGGITPRRVVNDAANSNSPLHQCFEWNDTKAADQFRLGQARKLIGSICVVQIDEYASPKDVRAFVHTTIGDARYEPIEVALSHPDSRAEVLLRAKREIALWKQRYAAYTEFAKAIAVIDELLSDQSVAA